MSTARIAQIGEKAAMSFTNIQTYCAGWDLRGDKSFEALRHLNYVHTARDQVSGSM